MDTRPYGLAQKGDSLVGTVAFLFVFLGFNVLFKQDVDVLGEGTITFFSKKFYFFYNILIKRNAHMLLEWFG